jgi:hypothetical protein
MAEKISETLQTDERRDSSAEEEEAIQKNIEYMNEFMNNLENRKGKITPNMESGLLRLRERFNSVVQTVGVDLKNDKEYKSTTAKQTGAIPKKITSAMKMRTIKKTESETSISTASDVSVTSNSSSCATNSSDYNGETHSQRKQPKKKMTPGRPRSNVNDFNLLVNAMKKMDMRATPAFESYDEDGGMDLKVYLKSFEDYCKENFRGAQLFWIGELEKKFRGETLKAFKAVRSVDDSYDSLKLKMIKWNDNQRLARRSKSRSKFVQATLIQGESVYLLATRLEKLFRVAFPSKDVNTSKTLREKFAAILPKRFKELLKTQILGHRMSRTKMLWDEVKQFASFCDLEKIRDQNNSEVEEVVINVGVTNQHYKPTRKATFRPTQGTQQGMESNRNYGNRDFRYNRNKNENGMQETSRSFGEVRRDTRREDSGNTRRFTGVPDHLIGKSSKCFYCGRIGHVAANCRSRTGACFICGAFGHFFNNCERRIRGSGQSRFSKPSWNSEMTSRPSTQTQINRQQHRRFQSQKNLLHLENNPRERRTSGN